MLHAIFCSSSHRLCFLVMGRKTPLLCSALLSLTWEKTEQNGFPMSQRKFVRWFWLNLIYLCIYCLIYLYQYNTNNLVFFLKTHLHSCSGIAAFPPGPNPLGRLNWQLMRKVPGHGWSASTLSLWRWSLQHGGRWVMIIVAIINNSSKNDMNNNIVINIWITFYVTLTFSS